MTASPTPAASQTGLHAASPFPSLEIAPGSPATAAGRPLLAMWHLLSLDAPTVAALWVIFIARAAGIALPWTEPAAMFVAVWMLYAADRLMDARSGTSERGLEMRHHFHHRYRRAFYAGLAIGAVVLAMLLRSAMAAAIHLDMALGALLLAWMFLVHLRPADAARLPKEFAVGIFFAAAVFVPAVARAWALRPVLLPGALLFAATCSLNCLFIFAWEHPDGGFHAHRFTRWAVKHLSELTSATVCIALFTATAGLGLPGRDQVLALPALACAGSAALLLMLHRHRKGLQPVTLRAAADLCLLTPMLLLIMAHFGG